MVDESFDHENDGLMSQFVVLFLSRDFQDTLLEISVKNFLLF